MQIKLTLPPKFYRRALSVWPHLLLRITMSSGIDVHVFAELETEFGDADGHTEMTW